MGDPHNQNRYGELWPQHKIEAYMNFLEFLKEDVTFSGGWAWHFLSPEGHPEYKHGHDHKDVDLFVPAANVSQVMDTLLSLGFVKVPTKYDRLPSEQDFRRYEQVVTDPVNGDFRLTIDFFVGDHPTIITSQGWKVIRPDVLLTFYSNIHSSDKAWAVQSAARMLAGGFKPEDLSGAVELTLCPDLDRYHCTKCGWSGQLPRHGGRLCGRCNYEPFNLGKPQYTKATR